MKIDEFEVLVDRAKLRSEELPVFRSCWNCNSAHEHLKKVSYKFWCFLCGDVFFEGHNMSELSRQFEPELQKDEEKSEMVEPSVIAKEEFTVTDKELNSK